MHMTNICDVCARPFRPGRADAKTCSAACRKALSRAIKKGKVASPPRRARVQPEESGLSALDSYVPPPVKHQAVSMTSEPRAGEAARLKPVLPEPVLHPSVKMLKDGDEYVSYFSEHLIVKVGRKKRRIINTTPSVNSERLVIHASLAMSMLTNAGYIRDEAVVMNAMPTTTRWKYSGGQWHIARVTLDGEPVVHATYVIDGTPTSASPEPVAPVGVASTATNTPPEARNPLQGVLKISEDVSKSTPLIVPDDSEGYNTGAPIAGAKVDADAALASILDLTQTFHWSGMVAPVTLDIFDGYRLMPPAAPEERIDPVRREGRRMVANPVKNRYWESGKLYLYLMDEIAGLVVDVANSIGSDRGDALRREEYAQLAYDLGLWHGGYLIMDSDALWDSWQPNSGWSLEVKHRDADAPDKRGRVCLCATVPDEPPAMPEPPEPLDDAPAGGAAKCDTDSQVNGAAKCGTPTTSGGTGKGKKSARGVQVRPFAEPVTWQGHYLNLHSAASQRHGTQHPRGHAGQIRARL